MSEHTERFIREVIEGGRVSPQFDISGVFGAHRNAPFWIEWMGQNRIDPGVAIRMFGANYYKVKPVLSDNRTVQNPELGYLLDWCCFDDLNTFVEKDVTVSESIVLSGGSFLSELHKNAGRTKKGKIKSPCKKTIDKSTQMAQKLCLINYGFDDLSIISTKYSGKDILFVIGCCLMDGSFTRPENSPVIEYEPDHNVISLQKLKVAEVISRRNEQYPW